MVQGGGEPAAKVASRRVLLEKAPIDSHGPIHHALRRVQVRQGLGGEWTSLVLLGAAVTPGMLQLDEARSKLSIEGSEEQRRSVVPDRLARSILRLADLRQKQPRSQILGRRLNGAPKFLLGLGVLAALQIRAPEDDAGAGIGGIHLERFCAERDGLAQSPQPSIAIGSPHGAMRRAGVGLQGRSPAARDADPPASARAPANCLRSEMAATVTCPIPFVKTKYIMLFFIFLS